MKDLFRSGIVPAGALLLMMVPQAFAGPIGDAFKETVNSSTFRYEATAGIDVGKGGELELPMNLSIDVRENGGKSQGVYGKEGSIVVDITQLEDLPSEFSDTTNASAAMQYRGAHVESSKTTYAELTSVDLSSDGRVLSDIMEMIEEMLEIVTGKSFKMSAVVFAERLEEMIGDSFFGPSDEELLMAALAGGNQSIAEVLNAVADLLDASVESGLLNMQSIITPGRNRNRAPNEYVLTLGDNVSVEGAAVFQEALASFMETVLPGLGSFAAEEIRWESAETIARDLNEMLSELSGVDMMLKVVVDNNRVQSTTFALDLSALNVPIMITEEVNFLYSTGYTATIPTADEDIIDMNQIINGFITIGEMTASAFSSSWDTEPDWVTGLDDYDYDYDFTEPSLMNDFVDYIPPTSMIAEDLYTAESNCNYESQCMREEAMVLRDWLKGMHASGAISDFEFREGMTDIRNILNYYMQF